MKDCTERQANFLGKSDLCRDMKDCTERQANAGMQVRFMQGYEGVH